VISIKKKDTILQFPVGEKVVLWIPYLNKYVLAGQLSADIIHQLTRGKSIQEIIARVISENEIPPEQAIEFVEQIRRIWEVNTAVTLPENELPKAAVQSKGKSVYSNKTYRINNIYFQAEYETADAEWINHPKFAYMEVEPVKNPHHHFRVEDDNNLLTLWVNGKHAGSWKKNENHFLSGRFSMQIVQKIYMKEEDQWMGVFHAAGISNGKNCILFFGESGNGKSTLSSLLMASGLDVLSDDFLPVESKTGLVYHFPAALSIKKQAYDLVMSYYPHLKYSGEYENPAFQKTYRFLPPETTVLEGVPCKAIVYIKYDPKVKFRMEKVVPEDSFVSFIPDSWIYPSKQNAKRFLEWFAGLEHYRLTYSNNKKMIETVKMILNSEK
jgi:hypothetical protein